MKNQLTYGKSRRIHDLKTGLLFLFPSLLIFVVFKYYVLGYNLYLSLTSWNFFSAAKHFIGLKNYQVLFGSPVFWKVLGNTLYYTLGTTVFSTIMGFILAVLLFNRQSVSGKLLKTLFFLPNITTASAMAILWVWIFDPVFGLSGQLFSRMGLESPRWLTDPNLAMPIVISLSVWRSAGFVMLIYISGLTAIPSDLYEAARVDGASKWQQLKNITIPLLSPTTLFLMMTSIISAMQVFDIIAVMTNGGPYNSTMVLNLYIYQKAFGESKAGYAAALSIILFILILGFTLLQKNLSKRWVKYV